MARFIDTILNNVLKFHLNLKIPNLFFAKLKTLANKNIIYKNQIVIFI